MMRIQEMCSKDIFNRNEDGIRSRSGSRQLMQNSNETVKLRLRGKGSGVREGPNHQES